MNFQQLNFLTPLKKPNRVIPPKAERIQKLLANQGLGSRREIEAWVEQGLVVINGLKAKLGDKATLLDRITVKGRPLRVSPKATQKSQVIIYHKPVGEICSRVAEKGMPTVFENLPFVKSSRWIMVGRLDVNTSGLLIFTNDGQLANALMHPRLEIEREYMVRVRGEVGDDIVKKLINGVELIDGFAKFQDIKMIGGEGSNQWYQVVLTEGRNREVRKLWESQHCQVSRLKRSRFGPIHLPRYLRQGKFVELSSEQLTLLYKAVDMEPPKHERHEKKPRYHRKN